MSSKQPRVDANIVANFQNLRQTMELKNSIAQQNPSLKESMKKNKTINQSESEKSNEGQRTEQQKTDKQAQDAEERYRNMIEHKITLDELAIQLGTNLTTGLTTEQAIELNRRYGDNILSEKKKIHPFWRYLKVLFLNPFNAMLWVGAILCIIAYALQGSEGVSNLYLAIVLIIVVFLTTSITQIQESKADAMMDSFKNFLPQACEVIRDGAQTRVPGSKLVPGDIVLMKDGEKIPADIRVLQSNEMKVDNSPLTGETEPLLRKVECTHPDAVLETANLCFFGTLVKEGRGKGVVIFISDNTVLGQIANLATGSEKQETPLRKELNRFVIMITAIALFLGVLFVLLGRYVVQQDWINCVVYGIGILVANVPEGLLGCITISLAITAERLSKRNVLVKNLESVETLGSTSCICSDKTGTLTQNKMTVEHVWYDDLKRKAKNRELFGPSEVYEYDIEDPSFKSLQECAIISSEARFEGPITVNTKYIDMPTVGDASETGLIKFFQPIEDILETRQKHKIQVLDDSSQARLPFNSANKFALSIVEYETDDSHWCVMLKGAPEKVWKYCTKILMQGVSRPINAQVNEKFQKVNISFGKNGERVLGFAQIHLNKVTYSKDTQFNCSNIETLAFPLTDFTFIGLISLIDPPKVSVPFAVLKCRSAGIKVIMVTGDQPPTATEIARQVNIIPREVLTVDELMEEEGISYEEAFMKSPAIAIHGDKINQAIEEAMVNNLSEDIALGPLVSKRFCVFARTTPAQKLKIVRACQNQGYIVGVTGDGVNDSPAIKQGNIGISMGISGSDVTKDAADMVLLNDDFSSIVDGVEEGRKIFDNLKKTIVYLLTSNMMEILPFLAFIIFQFPLPLSPILMLIICVGTDILPALSLAYEAAEIDIMTRKPRTQDDHLVSVKLITHAYLLQGWLGTGGAFVSFFSGMLYCGFLCNSTIGIVTQPIYYRPPAYPAFECNMSNPITFGNTNLNYSQDNEAGSALNANGTCKRACTGSETIQDGCFQNQVTPDNSGQFIYNINWNDVSDAPYDLRCTYVICNVITGSFQQWNPFQNETSYNPSNYPGAFAPANNNKTFQGVQFRGAYTTDAMFFGQTAYFVIIVFTQWSNIIACKQRRMSFMFSPINFVTFYGIALETFITILLLYVPGLNMVFGCRPLPFYLYAGPGLLFSISLLVWEESRKYCIRNYPKPSKKELSFFEKHVQW